MAAKHDETAPGMHFQSVRQTEVPKGRQGKHKSIVTDLLSDIQKLGSGQALRVPLAELPDTKENIRSALNRASKQLSVNLATSSDEEHLYIWLINE